MTALPGRRRPPLSWLCGADHEGTICSEQLHTSSACEVWAFTQVGVLFSERCCMLCMGAVWLCQAKRLLLVGSAAYCESGHMLLAVLHSSQQHAVVSSRGTAEICCVACCVSPVYHIWPLHRAIHR